MSKSISKDQKSDIAELLIERGYKKIYETRNVYYKDGHRSIDLDRISTTSELASEFYKAGSTDKIWDVKRVLEVVS